MPKTRRILLEWAILVVAAAVFGSVYAVLQIVFYGHIRW
jgi:hypothetical protein